jgi:hypothetical protein
LIILPNGRKKSIKEESRIVVAPYRRKKKMLPGSP